MLISIGNLVFIVLIIIWRGLCPSYCSSTLLVEDVGDAEGGRRILGRQGGLRRRGAEETGNDMQEQEQEQEQASLFSDYTVSSIVC